MSENYSISSHPRARIDLKRYNDGEREEDEERSEITSMGIGARGGRREGTARLLRRFKNSIRVSGGPPWLEEGVLMRVTDQTDFVLLPCDIVPPKSLSLSSILDNHRLKPDAVLTSVLYEPVEAIRDGG